MRKKRIPQDPQDLLTHFEDHLRFLEASGNAYDSGFESEAKRLAVSLRVLLHDTSKSKSLLTQLGWKDREFLDTALPITANALGGYTGLVALQMGPDGGRCVPFLDNTPVPPKQVPFEQWWNAPIFRAHDGASLSRQQLVQALANQDGGAHVDPGLDSFYARISRQHEMAWQQEGPGGSRPIAGQEKAAVRQIAHEVLKTIRPAYAKSFPDGDAYMTLSGVELVPAATLAAHTGRVGRNQPCWCGSGVKYKKCHGAPDAARRS